MTAIGVENIGRQFTPADPLLVASLFRSDDLETGVIKQAITLDTQDCDPQTGFRIRVSDSADSTIEVVTGVDVDYFGRLMERVFAQLPTVVENRHRSYRLADRPLDGNGIAQKFMARDKKGIYVSHVGPNHEYIMSRLKEIDPSNHYLIINASLKFSPNFAKLARHLGFEVVGLALFEQMASISRLSYYDDFIIASDRKAIAQGLGVIQNTVRLHKPIGEQIYISFHTKNQDLSLLEKSLAAIAKKYPNATLVHAFLPRSQIHYLPDTLQSQVTATLDILDRYFPKQILMRWKYVGMGDARSEMAAQAALSNSPVFTIGDISGGVLEEVQMYIEGGVTPRSLALGETDLNKVRLLSPASLDEKFLSRDDRSRGCAVVLGSPSP